MGRAAFLIGILPLTLSALLGCAIPASAGQSYNSTHYELRLVTIAEGLRSPWGLAFLPGGGMLVTERAGGIRIIPAAGQMSPRLAGAPAVYPYGQGGMLDVALDPDYAANNLIYLSYAEPGTSGRGGSGTAVARARLDIAGNRLRDLTVIFRQMPKSSGGRHFGSRLVFARDGRLFITIGERGQRERAQDFTINRGQVVRINPDGTIPADNPFVNKAGYRGEVWSHGHRNPQGAALHPRTGKLWTVEHGAMGGDEINIPLPGRNYGWPVIAYGRHYSGYKIGVGSRAEGMEQPAYYWDPSIAPSGMAFYTGDRFPKWRGNLFVGALKFRLLVRLTLDGEKVIAEERLLEDLEERIRDVRQGPDGLIYLLTDSGDGRILRLEPVAR
ncbi:MAG: PQQ-dependent sugar dehydrogenase [Rhodospirillaceae bacterium]|jgi:aldose sugar dehydrogenase|nr:PQQ-dependent sugar dehydrogenase [Rhodospirillaceae bacterium]MBT5194458.1 PQQ-dependent sugar dehydrogenase [Rhodospirillaceae bacterium]MBT5895262.1 PQQ-dependent sugar dehydrogenase [Rhodospirillaceae bacterium]MBT6430995.1 PQQ-dependent sugar dehydrogenase [Rhodospirillaceae bacterium]MBT7758429.1 PQQ-dependent sugar dehydrogenase [Rhodospirillaceae bacterium]